MSSSCSLPALLGNQRAIGNEGGAPEKYTEEWLREEAARFMEWMRQPESIFFKSFCFERGYHPNRLQEFADKSPEFSGALEMAKAWQEQKLVVFGLFNKTNASLTKFMLINCHGWAESKPETPQYDPLANIPPSTDLVDCAKKGRSVDFLGVSYS